MNEEYQNILVRLPKSLIQALESEARQTNRRYRSPQLEQILSERYNANGAAPTSNTSTSQPRRRQAA